MARYESAVELSFCELRHSRVILCIGEVKILQWTGVNNDYVLVDTITDKSVDYVTRGIKLRFEPAVGGAVVIEEGAFR